MGETYNTGAKKDIVWDELIKEGDSKGVKVCLFPNKFDGKGIEGIISIDAINNNVFYELKKAIEDKISANKKSFDSLPDSEKNTEGAGFSFAWSSLLLNGVLQGLKVEIANFYKTFS